MLLDLTLGVDLALVIAPETRPVLDETMRQPREEERCREETEEHGWLRFPSGVMGTAHNPAKKMGPALWCVGMKGQMMIKTRFWVFRSVIWIP